MKNLKIIVCSLFFLLFSLTNNAQFISAEVGIDGLTCSACQRSVEISIRKLGFVQDVQMNLENTNGIITFRPGAKVDIEKIAKAVINAGFSVRYLNAAYRPETSISISENYCLLYKGNGYQFVKVSPTQLNNDTVLKFIGKEFLPVKEYKKWKDILKPQCVGTNTTYFVTL
ncbi:MAG: heavy-metal-associated domain-containing protein [Bacteroidia bacterium]